MQYENFYSTFLPVMKSVEAYLAALPEQYSSECAQSISIKPIAYSSTRIKTPDSMIRKLKLHGFPTTVDHAMNAMYDAIGLRIVCSFVDDVYAVAEWLKAQPELNIVQIKDYIAFPKPNGYRSLHLLVKIAEGPGAGLHAEIQLRTIAIDFWATLEHQLKYKQEIAHEELVRGELKRCADEIASIDLSMQTIRDLISQQWTELSETKSNQ